MILSHRVSTLASLFLFIALGPLPAQVPDLYDTATCRTIEITIADPNWRTALAANWQNKTYSKASVKVDNKVYNDVGVRYRGYSTYLFLPSSKKDKRPLKIGVDAFVPGQRIMGYRTINLNNNMYDPTMVREILAYDYLREFMPAPRSNYVKVKVNNQDFGVFVNTQQINKDLLDNWFKDDDGNRYKAERDGLTTVPANNTALTWLGSVKTPYESSYILKSNPIASSWTDLINLCNVLNNTPAASLPTELPKVLDVDNALRFLVGGNIIIWLDSYVGQYCHNFYLYQDPYHNRFALLPWDMNNSFGGYRDRVALSALKTLDPFWRENETSRPRPLFGKTVANPRWRARYLAHYRTMLDSFKWSKLGARVSQLQAFIRPQVLVDPLRIYTMDQFSKGITEDIRTSFFTTLPGLKPLVEQRRTYLLQHPELKKVAPTLSALTRQPAQPDANDTVWIRVNITGAPATTVTLYHRWRGPYTEAPMFDDGKHHDGAANDGVYGASIPADKALRLVEYYVSAAGNLAAGGAMAFLPSRAAYAPNSYRIGVVPGASAIVVNEFMAKNQTGIKDEKGEFEDWIELANRSNTTVDISGMYLSDRFDNSTKWKIPPGYKIPAGQALVIWADEDSGDGPLHANFKINGDGEQLALFAADGLTGLDAVTFGPQADDISTGRLADFPGAWSTFTKATPNGPNLPPLPGNLAFGALDPTPATTTLAGISVPRIGGIANYQLTQAPANAPALFVLAIAPAHLDFSHQQLGYLLVDPLNIIVFPGTAGSGGQASFSLTIPNNAILKDARLLLQGLAFKVTGGFSNGVLLRLGS